MDPHALLQVQEAFGQVGHGAGGNLSLGIMLRPLRLQLKLESPGLLFERCLRPLEGSNLFGYRCEFHLARLQHLLGLRRLLLRRLGGLRRSRRKPRLGLCLLLRHAHPRFCICNLLRRAHREALRAHPSVFGVLRPRVCGLDPRGVGRRPALRRLEGLLGAGQLLDEHGRVGLRFLQRHLQNRDRFGGLVLSHMSVGQAVAEGDRVCLQARNPLRRSLKAFAEVADCCLRHRRRRLQGHDLLGIFPSLLDLLDKRCGLQVRGARHRTVVLPVRMSEQMMRVGRSVPRLRLVGSRRGLWLCGAGNRTVPLLVTKCDEEKPVGRFVQVVSFCQRGRLLQLDTPSAEADAIPCDVLWGARDVVADEVFELVAMHAARRQQFLVDAWQGRGGSLPTKDRHAVREFCQEPLRVTFMSSAAP
mmetsp:Transcript_31078/g.85089  ORF Transcript_31078/g.85089 Transcript_31078/m.85089 type:complete len:416 (+) Transcript_31078:89-1336(+)